MIGIDVSRWLLLAEEAKKVPDGGGTGGLPMPILLGVMALFGYLLLFRPEQKKKQEFRSMLSNLKEKDRVVTIGGIHGVVTNVQRDADMVTIRVDESTGAKIRVGMSAISRIVTDEDKSETA